MRPAKGESSRVDVVFVTEIAKHREVRKILYQR